ncbi:MAG: hypothetical protein ACREBC_26965 [Pyrinomonadaceae bacterium]
MTFQTLGTTSRNFFFDPNDGSDNERSSNKQHISGYFGSQYNKKIQFNGRVIYRIGHFDLDFGNLPKYPRASPSAIAVREATAAGLCKPPGPNEPDTRPVVCSHPRIRVAATCSRCSAESLFSRPTSFALQST